MAIFFCGDTHGRFGHVIDAVHVHRPDAIVFLGDLQPERPLEEILEPILGDVEIWFIHGNHDTDSDEGYDYLFGSALRDRNLHGRIVEIAGMRIAGLGGVFRGRIWWPSASWSFETQQDYCLRCNSQELWRDGLPRRHHGSIFPADYFRLIGQQADVLVTHEAPSCHPHGFKVIDELGRSLGVSKSFHGHHHGRFDYRAERHRLGFDAFGVSLAGITDTDGNIIVPGRKGSLCRSWSRRPSG